MCIFGTAFTNEQSLTQVGRLPQLLQTVLHGVRGINTYGLSRMSCTPKQLLSCLFIFLLNLHYLYTESPGSSWLSKISTLWSKSHRRVWAVFLGCLWRPRDRVVLLGIRQSPKGKNNLPGSIRIEENIGHKPLEPVTVWSTPPVQLSLRNVLLFKELLLVVVLACTNVTWKHDFPKKIWNHLTAGISQWWDLCAVTVASMWCSCWGLSCTRTPAEAVAPMLTSP